MLGYWRPHDQFQAWLEQKLSSFLPEHEKQIQFYANILEKVYILNLDNMVTLVLDRYSSTGRPAHNQPEIFRALFVMNHFKDSVTDFVKKLRAYPILATICGFEPESVPGVGTFYDYLNRYWLGEEPSKVIREPRRKKSKKPKKGEKLPDTDSNRVSDLVEQVLNGTSFQDRPEGLLQKILIECAVKQSIDLKLCGDPHKLVLAGDGAPLETGASHQGKKICSCKEQKIYNCSCHRQYTGPTATWGWDSYHERWYYGHTLYCITAASSASDLPLLIHLTKASRHDSGTFVIAYAQLLELYPHLKFSAALLDSAHDAYDIYRLLIEHDIEPFIDLNKRKSGIRTRSAVDVNDDGMPICMAGKEMIHNGACKGRRRIKWRCCMHKQPDLCEYQQQCSPSPYGRVFYTKMKDDFRLFTQSPRGSKAWKKAFARRTSVERTIKRILVDYDIENLKLRAEKRWFWAASLAAINAHLDAQSKVIKQPLLTKLGLNDKAA